MSHSVSVLRNLLALGFTLFFLTNLTAKETDSFIVVNKLPILINVSQMKERDFFSSLFQKDDEDSEYEVTEKILLRAEDCVKISSKDVGMIRIRSEFLYSFFSDGEHYITVCSLGECKAENSKIIMKYKGHYEGEQVSSKYLPTKCEVLGSS